EETKPVVEEVKPAAEETVQEEAKSLDEEPVEEEVKPVVDETAVTVNDPQINLLEDPKYRIYDIFDDKVIVFDDQKVDSDFPVEMRFTVPEGTDAVSIFTGYNTRNFPDTGELKLTKYTPGQEVVRYYPKYVAEDTYKKIVAYRNGQVYAEQVFTWSPMSLHVFLDVIDGVTDKEVYNAVVALKEAGVFKGNPDGTFGVDTPINRAGVATVLIRALYSDIDLETVKIGSNPFPDVKPDKWYANAMYVASGGAFEGSSLPAFIKGRPDGSADPDGNVKVEEFVTMVLRALEIPFDTTDPWYEGPISRAIAIGLISEEERSLIDQPLARGIVARIMVKALDLVEHLDELKALYPAAEVKDDHDITDIKDDKDLESSGVSSNNHSEVQAVAAFDLTSLYSGNGMGLTISWQSDFEGPFKVYRQKVDSDEEIYLGGSRGTAFRDTSVEKGQQYYYRVGLDGIEAETTEKVEILVEL
ncbi:MAG: S-layer homology domain-containing protein, partial [Candidatus Gracilibacteria bacterium]|nr:S-layer homology domain-containing protein [Candidatus Gracilibacteria bacterium]